MIDCRSTTATVLHYRKDGSSFWNEVALSPVHDSDGLIRHFVCVHSDVTARVLAQRDLESVYTSERMAHTMARSANDRFEAILEQMPVGVLIATAPVGRLIRGNTEMERIFGHSFVPAESIAGYDAYLAFHEDGSRYRPEEWPMSRALKGETIRDEEMVIQRGDGSSGIILMRAGPVHDDENKVVAAIAMFEDITERKRAERQLAYEREKSWALAATLQKSLLPPELPEVPGLALGASYVPVAEGLVVGGDFYDVFTQRDGSWVIVIGDVMGKGAEAAAVTSLARHALRTAGLRSARPSGLLNVLNQAILRDGERSEARPFCTVAAAVFNVEERGTHLSLSLGGHPRPIIVRADGEIVPTGRPGTLLGVFEFVDLYDVDITLNAGDSLVMYTDGVTEAHNEQTMLGEEGLAEILHRISASQLGAPEMAEAIQREVVEFSGNQLKDDVAILVVKVDTNTKDSVSGVRPGRPLDSYALVRLIVSSTGSAGQRTVTVVPLPS